MSRVKTLALTVVVLFALAGCAPMFEFNLFGALDTPPTPTAADYQGSDGLDQLQEDLDSPAVVDALAGSGLVDAIGTDIWDTYLLDGSVDDEIDAQAAIVYADLYLKTTEGEELVNNIVNVILEVVSGSGSLSDWISATTTVADILTKIIPPEARASEAVFTDTVTALLNANKAYLELGAYVDGTTVNGSPERDLPPGSLPGDVAQKALVAYTMAMTVDYLETNQGWTEAQTIAELFKVATGQASAATSLHPNPLGSLDLGIKALLVLGGVPTP